MTTPKQAADSEDPVGSLHGQIAVVTGANSGVGFATGRLSPSTAARHPAVIRELRAGVPGPGRGSWPSFGA